MKIAIIGAGISGLSCAYALCKNHDVQVLESAPRIGGHTATVDVDYKGEHFAIDTGFIVFNDWTYPHFINLLNELGVESLASDMSFSVSDSSANIEYAGSNLNTLFAQRKNLINLKYWRMLRDIIRFNRQATRDAESNSLDEMISLGRYLTQNGYSDEFKNWYLIPMGSAIWSASLDEMLEFPLRFFVQFFKNHGLLNIVERPQWRVVKGGSRSYLEPLTRKFKNKIRVNVRIARVIRSSLGVKIEFEGGRSEFFDEVVFACHSDTTLSLLADPDIDEVTTLSALPYRKNQVTLHTDTNLLPNNRRAWASWNYLLGQAPNEPPTLSYNMNILQGIKSDTTFIVSLNAKNKISRDKVIQEFEYDHPIFTQGGVEAQKNKAKIDGKKHTWFCGAYWRNGFHEDGCVSGFEVAEKIQQCIRPELKHSA